MGDEGVSVRFLVAAIDVLGREWGPRMAALPGFEEFRRHLAEAEQIWRGLPEACPPRRDPGRKERA